MSNVIRFNSKRAIALKLKKANLQASMSQLNPDDDLAIKLAEWVDKISVGIWDEERGRND